MYLPISCLALLGFFIWKQMNTHEAFKSWVQAFCMGSGAFTALGTFCRPYHQSQALPVKTDRQRCDPGHTPSWQWSGKQQAGFILMWFGTDSQLHVRSFLLPRKLDSRIVFNYYEFSKQWHSTNLRYIGSFWGLGMQLTSRIHVPSMLEALNSTQYLAFIIKINNI